jgi:subtilase family serine protease
VNGGVLTHCGICNVLFGLDPSAPAFFIFGGTSAGSPQWAALTADADQMAGHRLGDINQTLYQQAQSPPKYAADFHDVTTGNNDVVEIGNQGFNATTGWDPVTGLGSPNAANLLPVLAKKG